MAGWIRVSEALELHDTRLDTDRPTLRIREGKDRKSREVLVHPELQAALIAATSYGAVGGGPMVDVSRMTTMRRCPSRRGAVRTPPQAEDGGVWFKVCHPTRTFRPDFQGCPFVSGPRQTTDVSMVPPHARG